MRTESRSERDANEQLADSIPPDESGLREPQPDGEPQLPFERHEPIVVLLLFFAAIAIWWVVLMSLQPPQADTAAPAPASAPASGVRRTDAQRGPVECARPAARVLT